MDTTDSWQDLPFDAFTGRWLRRGRCADMRGSGCSGGAFDLMQPLSWLDGYDVVEALSAQEWVDDVALGDQSWPGLTQLYVASTRPPSLDAIVPGAVVADFYRDVFYPGGILNSGFGNIWATGRDLENAFPSSRAQINERIAADPICAANQGLRGQNASIATAMADHPFDDSHWQTRNAELLVGKIAVPTLQIVSWQDPQVGGRAAMLFELYDRGTPVRFIGTNGFHTYYDGDVWAEIIEFLDVYLRDTRSEQSAYEQQDPVTILLEKDNAGIARGRFTLTDLNAAGNGEPFRLGVELGANDGDPAQSTFTYDPSAYAGLGDLAWDPTRQDRVTFSSAPFSSDVVMAGPGSADLWIAADSSDVDLQVTITELRPDGQEMLVQSGWLRASHRALDEQASTPLRPRQLHTEAARV